MRALIVHGTDLLSKGFVAVPPEHHTEQGEPTNALLGAAGAIREALSFKEPDVAVAVVASRVPEGWPEPLRAQASALPGLLRAHGLHVVEAEAPEHVVASYLEAVLDAGGDAVVVGSDKRLAQLVGDRVWWFDGYKRVRYTPETVAKRFGVGPEHVAGWLALVGDDDALTGVKGIGKKGAVDLVAAHGSVEAALEDPEAVEGRAGKALRASLEEARAQLRIAVLDRKRPLPVPLSGLGYERPTVAALNEAYAALGFWSLLAVDPDEEPPEYVVCDTRAQVEEALAGLGSGAAAVVPVLDGRRLMGLAVSGRRGRAVYVRDPTLLAAWLADAGQPKVGHEINQVEVAVARSGLQVRGFVGDTAIASHLDDPSGRAPHDLVPVARVRLRRPVSHDPCALADAVGELWRALGPAVPREQLDEALALCKTLVRMELRGMLVDREELVRVGEDFEAKLSALEGRIHEMSGHPFALSSPKQLGTVLYEELGLPVLSRTKTGWSTATHVLERLVGQHPIVPLVIGWRRLQRLRDGWVTALQGQIEGDGRVHASIHPARSFSGRLVFTDPDLGRVPGRTEEMARIRRAFGAPEGWCLLSVDYDQLGLYMLAHLSRDPALVEPLRRGDDLHRLTASAVLDVPAGQIDADQRQIGKVVNFATFAGQGSSALAQQLGVTPQQARAWIERFDQHYAGVRAFQDEQLELARERGEVQTVSGRRWRIGGLGSHDVQLRAYAERMARRAALEGSVADVSRRGLLRADQALQAAGLRGCPLLQVHDEVLFEVPAAELQESCRVAAEAMRDVFDLEVPLRVGCKAGRTWADMQAVASR